MDGIENAFIERVELGMDDHGFLTFWLHLSFDSCGQGFGGYALDDVGEKGEDGRRGPRRPSAACGLAVARILEVVGVEKWEELRGRPCRVERRGGLLCGIGHFTQNNWFYPAAEFKALESPDVHD